MSYGRDLGVGQNPHVNYEPSITGGLREGQYQTEDIEGPKLTGRLTRARIPAPTTTSRPASATSCCTS